MRITRNVKLGERGKEAGEERIVLLCGICTLNQKKASLIRASGNDMTGRNFVHHTGAHDQSGMFSSVTCRRREREVGGRADLADKAHTHAQKEMRAGKTTAADLGDSLNIFRAL